MADRTLTINHADGGSETYTINRDKFAGVRDMVIDGANVSVDRTAVPKEQSKETTFGGSQSITVNRDIEPLLSKVVGGAAAAYSLRDLNDSQGNNNVVRVRRESDNSEKDFKAKEVSNGTMARWVNEQPTLPLDLRELDTNTGERDGALIEAAAAYSLRKLKEDFTGDVVQVRRNVDGETEGFTADEVTDGTLESFVNASFDDELPLDQATGAAAAYSLRSLGSNQWTYGGDTLEYESDFSAGVDGWSGIASTAVGNIDNVGGRDDCLRVTPNTAPTPHYISLSSAFTTGSSYTVSFDFYIPSSNVDLNGIDSREGGGSGSLIVDEPTPALDTWVSTSGTHTGDGTSQLHIRLLNGGNHIFSFNGTDVIYIRNVKVYETLGDTEYLPSGKYVVQTRRSSDDAVKSFTASEVADGTLEAWVNTDLDITNRLIVPSDITTRFVVTSSTDASNYNASIDNDSASTDFAEIRSGLFGEGRYRLRGTLEVSDLVGDIKVQTNGGVGGGTQFVTLANGTNNLDFQFDITGDGSTTAADSVRLYFLIPDGTSATVDVSNLIWEVTQADGHVRTWYDQSGSDNHAVQTTTANQPKIVDSGSLITGGGLSFDGTDDYLWVGSMGTTSDFPLSTFAVFDRSSTAESVARTIVSDNNRGAFGDATLDFTWHISYYSNSTLTPNDGFTVGSKIVATGLGSDLTDSNLSQGIHIGRDKPGYSYLTGTLDELIIYNTDQSTKRRAIEENIANHYDITLSAFSRDGTVSTWYDQSGNTNDATQTDPTKQPKIVDGGSLVTGGLDFDGDRLNLSSEINTSSSHSLFAVAKTSTTSSGSSSDYPQLLGDNISGKGFGFFANGLLDKSAGSSNSDGLFTFTSNTLEKVISVTSDNSNITAFQNGVASSSNPIVDASFTNKFDRLGGSEQTSRYFDGTIQEIIVYTSDQSDNRTAIEANIGETYGITDIPAANDTVNGYVQTWYDQSGNGNDAEQSAATKQPKIVGEVTSGQPHAVLEDGIYFDGTDDELTSPSIAFGDNPNTVFTLVKSNDLASKSFFTSLGDLKNLMYHENNGSRRIWAGTAVIGGVMSSNQELWSGFFDNPNDTGTLHVNGTQEASGSIGANVVGTETIRIGANNGANPLNGWFKEIIIYNSDQSANRPAIEANILNQYDI